VACVCVRVCVCAYARMRPRHRGGKWNRACQQPGDQPTPRRTKLRHGLFCGVLSAVRLPPKAVTLCLPPKAECVPSFFGLRSGFGLGWLGVAGRSPVRAPPPQRFLRSCGAGESIWACQLPGGRRRGPNRPKMGSLWAAGGSEIASRRADIATTYRTGDPRST
jgi:hypothetical protein